MKLLVVVDMQNDFVTGVLGTKEAESIVDEVVSFVKSYEGEVVYTMDTHATDYLETMEGKNLPIVHCVKETKGWEIIPELKELLKGRKAFLKPTFGSIELMEYVKECSKETLIEQIDLIGVCTDICVISNAMLLKAALHEVPIVVHQNATAGVSVDSHKNALKAMQVCQIQIK